MSTELTKTNTAISKPLTTKDFFSREDIRKKFESLLGQKAQGFITSVLQVVNGNNLLKNADPMSVYNAASVAAILDLPINQNLGFAYIVPYNESYRDEQGNWKKRQVAQFQMGYKGFIQLAQRSGQFKTISAAPIYEGQLVESNPLTGFVFDFTKKTSDKVIGYAGYFQLLNGFEKTVYATVDELKAHGKKYSQTFKTDKGIWVDNFDAMATKTVIKLMLSKFAPLSIEMQKAITLDQGVIKDETGDDVQYIDHEEVVIDKEEERVKLLLSDCQTIEDVEMLENSLPEIYPNLFAERKEQLTKKKGK
jgi:recombination protein RecT